MNTKNLAVILVLVSISLVGFFLGKYHERAGIFFIVNYLAVMAIAAWAAVGMKTRDVVLLIVSSFIIGGIVEHTMTSEKLWTYFGGGYSLLFAVSGWSFLMLLILSIAKYLSKFIRLMVNDSYTLRILPVLGGIILMMLFMRLGGYFEVISWQVVLVYSAMTIASLYYSYKHSLGWGISLMISSLIIGGYMEVLGSLGGLWHFHFSEILPPFLVFAWTLNTWTVHTLCLAFGVDFE